MSLNGLRRALAEDKTFARVRTEAGRPFESRSSDYQISAPTGMRSVLLAEMADALATGAAGDPVVLAVTATGREAEDLTGSHIERHIFQRPRSGFGKKNANV